MKVSKYRMMELNGIGLVLSQTISLMNITKANPDDDCSLPLGYIRNLYDAYMELLEGVEVEGEDTWLDYTDYFPSADGFGYDPTEPYWNFVCPRCDYHYFDSENPPDICPECKARLKR